MEWFWSQVGNFSDVALLLKGAAITGVAALAIAWASRYLMFSTSEESPENHSQLADLVHGSLLAFTVFTLALVLADVRANLGETLDSTLEEASIISRLDAELQEAGGPEASLAAQDLRSYAEAVATYDWPSLGQVVPKLSREADLALKSLRSSGRAAAKANPDSTSAINAYLTEIEDFRFGRLESATKSVPNVFWLIIYAFLVGAMVMNGRLASDRTSSALVFLHMAGIGLVLALIVVMDQPFRGQTSVSSDPIARALDAEGSEP